MAEWLDLPYEGDDVDASTFEHAWADGRVDFLPLGIVYNDGDDAAWAPLGEVAVLGSYCSGSMTSGFDGARLARRTEDLWVCVLGDEDREFVAIRAGDPHDAFEQWFSIASSRLDQFNWEAVVAANALGMVDDLPAESEGFVDAGLFEDPARASSRVSLWGVDVLFRADAALFPRDWLVERIARGSWLLAAKDPGTPEAALWAQRRDEWLGLFER